MTEQEIIDGNKLIGKFDKLAGSYSDLGWLKTCRYHTSWDWLMPAVEKIEAMQVKAFDYDNFSFSIARKYCLIHGHSIYRQTGLIYQTPYGFNPDSKIHAVWLAVLAFITWYNAQTTNP